MALVPEHDWQIILHNGAGSVVLYNKKTNELTVRQNASMQNQHVGLAAFSRNSLALLPSAALPPASTTQSSSSAAVISSDYFRLLAATTKPHSKSTDLTPRQQHQHDGPWSREAPADLSDFLNEGYYRRFFVEERKLGVGGWGHVYQVRHVISNIDLGVFALKKVPIGDSVNRKWFYQVIKEVKLLEQLKSHPNIISYRHSWLERDRVADVGPEVTCAFILMDWADGGNLEDYVANTYRCGRILSDEEICNFFVDILLGIDYLHSLQFCHRDIKPANLLLRTNTSQPGSSSVSALPTVMLSDFGTSISTVSGPMRRTGATGTVEWLAPELLADDSVEGIYYDSRSDMWSIGLVLYYMAYGKLPWKNANIPTPEGRAALIQEILSFTELPPQPSRSPNIDSVLRLLLRPDPQSRPTARELLQQHHWIHRIYTKRRLSELYTDNVPNYEHFSVCPITQVCHDVVCSKQHAQYAGPPPDSPHRKRSRSLLAGPPEGSTTPTLPLLPRRASTHSAIESRGNVSAAQSAKSWKLKVAKALLSGCGSNRRTDVQSPLIFWLSFGCFLLKLFVYLYAFESSIMVEMLMISVATISLLADLSVRPPNVFYDSLFKNKSFLEFLISLVGKTTLMLLGIDDSDRFLEAMLALVCLYISVSTVALFAS